MSEQPWIVPVFYFLGVFAGWMLHSVRAAFREAEIRRQAFDEGFDLAKATMSTLYRMRMKL